MKKNRKNSKKSLLACAVLASVMSTGATALAAVSATDDASIGTTIQFGSKRYLTDSVNSAIYSFSGPPSWQIAKVDDGLILLAKDPWGYTRFSTSGQKKAIIK